MHIKSHTTNRTQDPINICLAQHADMFRVNMVFGWNPDASLLWQYWQAMVLVVWVNVQFRGPELYKKKRGLFQEESYLPRIFRFSSLNLHTFHLIHIVFWWQIFFRKHGKSTPNDREDHHVLVVVVMIMTSQCRCTRALSQSHVAKHDNHVPVAPLIGSGLGVMSMQWLPYGKIISTKTLKLH